MTGRRRKGRVWLWYRLMRVLRHLVGLHDWNTSWPDGHLHIRCTWCGKSSPTGQAEAL